MNQSYLGYLECATPAQELVDHKPSHEARPYSRGLRDARYWKLKTEAIKSLRL